MFSLSKKAFIDKNTAKNIEILVVIIYLLYFLDIQFPYSLSSIFNAISYPITFVLVALYWKKILYVATRNIPLLIFIGIALISFLWTTNMANTSDGSRGLLRTFLFGSYFVTRYSLKEQIKILVCVFGLVAIISILFCAFFPHYAYITNGWAGIFPYKNLLGRAMVLSSMLFSLILIKSSIKDSWFVFFALIGLGVSTLLILISNSSMSLLLFLTMLPQTFFYFVVRQKYRTRFIFVSLIFILLLLVFASIFFNLETIFVDILGEGLTFNGRTPIWTLMTEKILDERPVLGYGYQAFWSSDAGSHVIMHTWASLNALPIPTTFNAHNAYIEIFASLGFLGLFSYGAVLINALYKIAILLFSTKKLEFFWLFQFLVFILLASLADVGIGLGNTSSYGILSIAAFLSISLEYERFRKQKKLKTATINYIL